MLEAYKQYKEWWLKYQEPEYVGWDEYGYKVRGEEAFEHFWGRKNNYFIFETLIDWTENPNMPEGN